MNTTFPRVLTLLRKERGLSQKQAAAELKISQALLSHYEKGIRECGLDFVVRAADFYGELKSSENTVIILCDNKNTLEKLGGDHDTQTAFFPSVKNYISLSPDYFNINILAHELTHAELHTRLSSSVMKKLPVWFNEGLAMQNDNRKTYNEDAWRKLTDDGKKTVALTDMDEESEFYAGTDNDKLMRYVCARHEVSEWMSRHGRQGLLELIDNLNNGEDFYTVYAE